MKRASINYQKEIAARYGHKPIAYNPQLVKVVGSVIAGIFLNQLLHWHGAGVKGEWTYKTIAEVERETALTRREQDEAIKKLKKLGVLEMQVLGVPPKRHFRVNLKRLYEMTEGFESEIEYDTEELEINNVCSDDLYMLYKKDNPSAI